MSLTSAFLNILGNSLRSRDYARELFDAVNSNTDDKNNPILKKNENSLEINSDQLDIDTIIYGQEKIMSKWNAGLDTITHNSVTKLNGMVLNITNTSTTESIDVSEKNVIRQTSIGITTTLTSPVLGQILYIKNVSGGSCTLNITIDGVGSPTIDDEESFTICYNGVDWDLL